MTEDKKNLEIATFRFGVIGDFVTGVKLSYGEKEKLIREKTCRSYQIPYTDRTTISRTTILEWILAYKDAGFKLNGLYPKTRKDKGNYRRLDSSVRFAIKNYKELQPDLTVPMIIKKLQQQKIIAIDEYINLTSVYRFLKQERVSSINSKAVDRLRFEAEYPNQIWQSDVMHGPQVNVDGISRKAYLCAIIDDHSRMITHAEFYPSESIENLKDCLQNAVKKRGLPQKFYVDNGSCYSAINLQQITALLGISLIHARPYTPQGKGKIERWFRNIRNNFLPLQLGVKSLSDLNEALNIWVDEYNSNVHSSTGMTPNARYRANLECVRPAPTQLSDYFRNIEFRRVRKDRTFQLRGIIYEAPSSLIDKKIEARYHKNATGKVEIFFNNQSFGFAEVVDVHVNARIGRAGIDVKIKEKDKFLESKTIPSGQLFGGGSKDEEI